MALRAAQAARKPSVRLPVARARAAETVVRVSVTRRAAFVRQTWRLVVRTVLFVRKGSSAVLFRAMADVAWGNQCTGDGESCESGEGLCSGSLRGFGVRRPAVLVRWTSTAAAAVSVYVDLGRPRDLRGRCCGDLPREGGRRLFVIE